MADTLNHDTIDTPPVDAASVILIRDQPSTGLEVLLLCRGKSRTVMNSAWVFPGGKLDTSDFDSTDAVTRKLGDQPATLLNEPDLDTSHAAALFNAACRETQEETGVILEPDHLHPWSRWITPKEPAMMKKRFDARFFIAIIPDGQHAVHDGAEATASMWSTPRNALTAYYEKEITLAPPQIMTLASLSRLSTGESCISYARARSPHHIEPGIIKGSDDSRTLVYPGDPEHPIREQSMPGPTRLIWQNNRFEPANGLDGFFSDQESVR